MRLLPICSVVIESGQRWDYVDSVAPRLHEPLARHRDTMEPVLRKWGVHQNFWFHRTAIIAQLPAKGAMDTQLLQDVIAPNLADKEFFIREAIGWALRQYAQLRSAETCGAGLVLLKSSAVSLSHRAK